eukprot:scaffold1871_cov225-Ochromonas_danica.AAC.1
MGQFFLPILQQLIRCVEGQPILMDLVKEIFEEKENAKIQKKINIYKAKLMQLEDLFEAFIIQSLLSPSSSSASEMAVEKGEEGQNVAKGKEGAMWWFISQCIEQDSLLFSSKEKESTTPQRGGSEGLEEGAGRLKEWSRECDLHLLRAVGRIGWPDGKRRVTAIQQEMMTALPGIFRPVPTTITSIALTVGGEQTMVHQDQETEAEGGRENMDYLTSRNLIPRLRALCRLFRHAYDDVHSVLKAQEAARLTQAKTTKKNVQAVLKAIQKLGYPHRDYDEIR